MKGYINLLLGALLLFSACQQNGAQSPIDRKSVVTRHNVTNNSMDTLSSLTVGNGTFAYTVDATGMQTFTSEYVGGVSLGTQSEWAWNSFDNEGDYKFEETLKSYDFNNEGRDARYSVQHKVSGTREQQATEYFRVNPHRLQLGNVGLELHLASGQLAGVQDIQNINQTIDLWTGLIHSTFSVEGETVEVFTAAGQTADQVAVKVSSSLISKGRLKVFVRYPFPSGKFLDDAAYYGNPDDHQTKLIVNSKEQGVISHKLSGTNYFTGLNFSTGQLTEQNKHYFVYTPDSELTSFDFSFAFNSENNFDQAPVDYESTRKQSTLAWEEFWNSGAAVDFAGSTDPRADELERRVILSQYLTRVQCGGSNPPQETGLTFNSWYGKPHTEMHWWHGVHYALWGRADIMEKTLDYYLLVE